MAEGQLTVESPEFEYIRREAGIHTRDAIVSLWLVANNEAKLRRTGDREAIERIAPKLIELSPSAQVNDLDTQFATVLDFIGSTSVDLTGLQARVVPTFLFLVVRGSGTITLKNQNAGSLDRNRIVTSAGGDVAIATNEMAMLIYINSRWRQFVWA